MEVTRIEAVVGTGAARRALPAAVVASDPELDLAVLAVTSGDLPYMPFGDSDAVDPGQETRVLGFPYGRRVEVARPQQAGVAAERHREHRKRRAPCAPTPTARRATCRRTRA